MTEWYEGIPTLEKHLLDIFSVGTVIGAMTSHLPAAAALFTLVWTGIRIYETTTVQKLLGKNPEKETKDDG